MIRQGDRLPDTPLATVACGQLVEIPLGDLLADRTVAIVGLPGAFTPVCTGHHLPLLIHSRARLTAAGIDRILCVAPDNPWAMAAWRANLPGAEDFHFLSDANHHLIRALGMATRVESLHLGTTSRRWLVIARDGVVLRLRVEPSVLDVTCTGPDAAVAMMDEVATAPAPGPELALVG
ncbi:MAG: redoxin family protein [Azospirillaceae bacterium]